MFAVLALFAFIVRYNNVNWMICMLALAGVIYFLRRGGKNDHHARRPVDPVHQEAEVRKAHTVGWLLLLTSWLIPNNK